MKTTTAKTTAARALILSLLTGTACGGGGAASAPSTSPSAGEHGDHAGEHGDHAAAAAPAQHEHHGGMPHRFERAEDWARLFDDPSREAWQKPDEVVTLLQLSPGMTVVDLGAGTGYFLSRLSRAVGPTGSVIGTDIEPDMVRYMKERAQREGMANVRAIAAPTDDVGIPAGSADRILVVDVWHHVGDRERYAARMARALRPGGAVAIVDFTLESRRGPPAHHRLAADKVIAELRAGGLSAELATESLPDQYVVIGRRP
ncbi:MAG TPA: class I SAM-dependent methyltransferase [Kofleriaceae bacterium]|nr:class I SAM-dependent methyltransferase [Kofleriaceae bacterium]